MTTNSVGLNWRGPCDYTGFSQCDEIDIELIPEFKVDEKIDIRVQVMTFFVDLGTALQTYTEDSAPKAFDLYNQIDQLLLNEVSDNNLLKKVENLIEKAKAETEIDKTFPQRNMQIDPKEIPNQKNTKNHFTLEDFEKMQQKILFVPVKSEEPENVEFLLLKNTSQKDAIDQIKTFLKELKKIENNWEEPTDRIETDELIGKVENLIKNREKFSAKQMFEKVIQWLNEAKSSESSMGDLELPEVKLVEPK